MLKICGSAWPSPIVGTARVAGEITSVAPCTTSSYEVRVLLPSESVAVTVKLDASWPFHWPCTTPFEVRVKPWGSEPLVIA